MKGGASRFLIVHHLYSYLVVCGGASKTVAKTRRSMSCMHVNDSSTLAEKARQGSESQNAPMTREGRG